MTVVLIPVRYHTSGRWIMYTVQYSIRTDGLELFSSQDSRDFRNFSLKEKLKEEKYEEAKETMVEVWRAPDIRCPVNADYRVLSMKGL